MLRRHTWMMFFLGAFVVVTATCLSGRPALSAASSPTPGPASNDAACAQCHQAIYDHYRKTPMAQASGPVFDGLLTGSFTHVPSGIEYKVFIRDHIGWMSYQRAASPTQPALSGERQLRYFVGSGHRGRTYLYAESGLWFEAPINYYSKKGIWDMAPNYGNSHAMPDGLPIDPNCLHCHATDVQPSLPSARNRYADVPFVQGGIGCSSCHGDPAEHLAHPVMGNIINPSKLTAAKRDSVCLQCHLEGDAAIYLAGKSLADFRPGEDLSSYVNYFVKASAQGGGGRAASQYEALLRSRCKIASGDKLTCTTCHDPHASPSAAESVNYFRSKCLICHTGEHIALQHHPEQRDCAVCHMPTRATTDISHEQTTDHNIQRRPASLQPKLTALTEPPYRLIPVGNVVPGDREFGLAYAQSAIRGNQEALLQALQYLQRAESAGADDAELYAQLGLVDQIAGQVSAALQEYDRALMKDPRNSTAMGNKAVLDASSGNVVEAIHLLQQVILNDPSQVAAGLNLAFIRCAIGNKDQARTSIADLLRFSPDDPAARNFLQNGVYGGKHCDLRSASAAQRATP